MSIKYFMFSKEQMDIRIKTDEKMGRKYLPGKVIVQGKEKMFTEIADSPESRFKDARIVTKGELNKIKYQEPISE